MSASQANLHEMEQLKNEIAFQKVLLASIDDFVEDRENAEAEVRTEIKTLEKKLRALLKGPSASGSQSMPSHSQNLEPTPSPSNSQKDMTNGDFSTAGSGHKEASGAPRNLKTTSTTSSSPTSLPDTISPSKMSLPSRKRSHSKHVDGQLLHPEPNKSRRTTPSPGMTDAATPATSSGDEDFELFDNSFFSKQQQEIENRIKQEKQDAEYAHALQNGHANPPAQTSAGVSAFDRLYGLQRPASSSASTNPMHENQGPFSRAPISSGKPRSQMKGEKPSTSTATVLSSSYSKPPNEVKNKASLSRAMPGAFVDDSSAASDSDLEIVSADAFHDNGRHVSPQYASKASVWGSGNMKEFQSRPEWRNASCLPNSRQTTGSPGYPRPNYGMSNPLAYGNPQNGYVAGNSGMYPCCRGGSMHISGSSTGYPLKVTAGGHLGNEFNINQPSPTLGLNILPRYSYLDAVDRKQIAFNPPNSSTGLGTFPNLASPGDYMSDIFSRPNHHQMGEQYDYIMNDPRKTNEEIKALLENIRPDADLPVEDREGTPDGLVYPLYEHQKIALTWMKSMEEGTNKGGILADDMGLGKTISALALILSRPSTDRARKTTLIVGPVALLRQWEREIRSKVKVSHRMSTHMVHGQGRKLSWDELRNFDVVLTTYGTLGAEYKRLEIWLEKQKENGNEHDYDRGPMNKLFPLLGPKSLFYRIFLDEAHCIKNKATKASKAAKNLTALTRWCLTGTPMMNNVGEFYSLIHFLRIRPYNEWQRFQDCFGMLTRGDATDRSVQAAMKKLQALIKAILLRRTKKSQIDGKPIINLPPKTEEIQHVVFSEEEREFYEALETRTQIQFNKYLRANTVGKNYSNVLVLLLRLRQACCHPHLITDFEEASPEGATDAMIELAKTLTPEVVGRLLAAEGFECPVCYDAVENPSIAIPCGHDTCVECLSKISDQNVLQNQQQDGNEADAMLKCPTCRGKIDLKKIIDYATFKKVHKPDEASKNDDNAVIDDDGTESETDSDSSLASATESEDDADRNGDLRDFVVPDDIEDTDEEKGDAGDDGDDEAEVPKRKSKSKKAKNNKRQKMKKGKDKKEKKNHVSLAMLKAQASRSREARRAYMKYLRKHWQPSAKVDKCIELLEKFQDNGKTIVFSQFVSLLDLVQVPIDQKGWKVQRYDGAMNADARNDAVIQFTDNPNVKIMLISLKAGNYGLNLVAASRVIILDPFWNPFIEMQAVDRAYRIGQQKPVEVHRILIKDTVEDRIIELQEKKRKLVDSALDEGAGKALSRLDVHQLAFLFGVGARPE